MLWRAGPPILLRHLGEPRDDDEVAAVALSAVVNYHRCLSSLICSSIGVWTNILVSNALLEVISAFCLSLEDLARTNELQQGNGFQWDIADVVVA